MVRAVFRSGDGNSNSNIETAITYQELRIELSSNSVKFYNQTPLESVDNREFTLESVMEDRNVYFLLFDELRWSQKICLLAVRGCAFKYSLIMNKTVRSRENINEDIFSAVNDNHDERKLNNLPTFMKGEVQLWQENKLQQEGEECSAASQFLRPDLMLQQDRVLHPCLDYSLTRGQFNNV